MSGETSAHTLSFKRKITFGMCFLYSIKYGCPPLVGLLSTFFLSKPRKKKTVKSSSIVLFHRLRSMKKVPLKAWAWRIFYAQNGRGSLQRSRFLGTYLQGVIFLMFCLFLTQDWGGGNIIIRLNRDRMDHMKFLVSLGANVGKHELMWGDHIWNHFRFFCRFGNPTNI